MDSYEVRLTRSAEKELTGLFKPLVTTLWQSLKALADQPRPTQTRKLMGAEKAYRFESEAIVSFIVLMTPKVGNNHRHHTSKRRLSLVRDSNDQR